MPGNGGAKFLVTLAVSMCPMSLLSVLCSVSQLCLLCPIYLGKCREHLIHFPVNPHTTTCTLHSLNSESLLSSKQIPQMQCPCLQVLPGCQVMFVG